LFVIALPTIVGSSSSRPAPVATKSIRLTTVVVPLSICQEFKAKLSDFGLAKEGPMGGETHVSTRVMGTYGYAAPEYIATGRYRTFCSSLTTSIALPSCCNDRMQ